MQRATPANVAPRAEIKAWLHASRVGTCAAPLMGNSIWRTVLSSDLSTKVSSRAARKVRAAAGKAAQLREIECNEGNEGLWVLSGSTATWPSMAEQCIARCRRFPRCIG